MQKQETEAKEREDNESLQNQGQITATSSKDDVARWFQTYEGGYFAHFMDLFKNKPAGILLGYTKDDLREFCQDQMMGTELYNALHPAQTVSGPITVPSSANEDLIRLIKSFDAQKEVDPHIVDRAIKRFGVQVTLALAYKNVQAALDVYEDASKLPQTSTMKQFEIEGLQLDGSLISGNENILVCFDKDAKPSVLKVLNEKEYLRLKALETLPDQNQYLISFKLIQTSPTRNFAIMPLLPVTLEHMKSLGSNVGRFWDQMKEALLFLHHNGFAHMDVKPSNICIDSNGNFILIDLGSTVKFGAKTSSTPAYIPTGVNALVASPDVDFWMLAATVTERACSLDRWGAGAANPKKENVISLLEENLDRALFEHIIGFLKN
eukprot:TRINITY_DN8875_c0_g1_i2.p1 TRINITY_DN8875_c0_g1~~TRINITY_DN8875_c0_g1_i2.p1  ORF type:complete len:420 (-),score=76.16 TRINITY_DN8875_c0_g1_i2:36-1172(-)